MAKGWLDPSHHWALQPRELGPTCSAPAPHSGHHHHARLQTRRQSKVGVGSTPPLTIAHYGRLGRSMLSQWHLEYLEDLVTTQNRYLPPAMQILPQPTQKVSTLSNLASLAPANLGPSASIRLHRTSPSNKSFWLLHTVPVIPLHGILSVLKGSWLIVIDSLIHSINIHRAHSTCWLLGMQLWERPESVNKRNRSYIPTLHLVGKMGSQVDKWEDREVEMVQGHTRLLSRLGRWSRQGKTDPSLKPGGCWAGPG